MTRAEIEDDFPGLIGQFFEITSPPDENYNCISWSVNNTAKYWWPIPPGAWPGRRWLTEVPQDESLDAFLALYKRLLFVECDSPHPEAGFDKIAIYAGPDGLVTHAARCWKEDLGWSSKLGEENDICHYTLESLEGNAYGKVVRIMKRRRPATKS